MNAENKRKIYRLKQQIEMMRADEKVFGLVREDLEKINLWIKEIVLLKKVT